MVRTLGVIPARGGSKRLPGKNLRLLCGKPLIGYTIDAAEQSTLTDWVVSTEDYEIGRVAVELGAYVVRRPEELAEDHVDTGPVLRHALEWMGDYDMVVCLHPTSPVRDRSHIDLSIDMLWNSQAPSLASVACRKRTYIHNASIYALKTEFFNGTHYSDQSIPFLMDKKHSLDVDTEEDFKLAEIYLAGRDQDTPVSYDLTRACREGMEAWAGTPAPVLPHSYDCRREGTGRVSDCLSDAPIQALRAYYRAHAVEAGDECETGC
jgi:CMP-N,N'-diacetyllegionaminic acid synthase